MAKKNYVTYKDKYNEKYGYAKNTSHTLEQVSKDTGVSIKGLQQIYNKGIGAYKTNPSSVRPNVKSKEQWAMARVYSAVMGGKTARIDKNELKMEKGGLVNLNAFNKHTKVELKKWDYEHLETNEEKRNAVIFLYAREFYKKHNITPLAEPDNDGVLYWQRIAIQDEEYIICFNLRFWDYNNPLKVTEAFVTFHDEDYNDIPNPIKMQTGGTIGVYTSKLIEELKKHSNHEKSEVFTNSEGEKYIYHHWKLKYRSASNWLVQLFMRASKENTGVDYNKQFAVGDYSFYYDRPEMKGQPNGSMQMRKLEVLGKYEKGGMTRKYAEGGSITQYEIEAMRNYIKGKNPNPKLKASFEKVLAKYQVDLKTSDLRAFPQGKYVNPYDFSGYEYMRSKNEEAGVMFLLTGEYELVSKAIYEKDYAMWLFYSYLGRINISFKACQDWLQQAQEYFEFTMPIPVWLVHTPRAEDGRSYALWFGVSEEGKQQAESRIGRPLIFDYNGTYYYNEIGMVGNYDFNNDGWGTLYRERKTGLLIPEYTETSFHFTTLIHEFAHCLDFQSQLIQNIEKFNLKSSKKEEYVNTEKMSDAELALYSKQLQIEAKKGQGVSRPITNHFTEFVDSLIRVLRACAGGHIPLTQLYEQQALDVQQALAGTYGDLLLAQRERQAKERKELAKEDEMRDNKRFTWQSSWINDVKQYAIENARQIDLKEKLTSSSKTDFTLTEAIELDNLITGYFNTEFKKYMLKNPSKATQRLEDIKMLKKETNRIINNHYDNVKSGYQYGFKPQNELETYIDSNCKVRDFRDYKSWKECTKESLQNFQ